MSVVDRISDQKNCCISDCISGLEAVDRILLDTLFVCKTGSDGSAWDGSCELQDLKNQIEKDINNLRNRTLNLAVCGLEKSGKTSLIAGLVGGFKLTFSHKANIRYECGDKDVCELHFYSSQEFDAFFRNMLQSVGFDAPAGGLAEMDAMAVLEVFEDYWKLVEANKPALYAEHGRTARNIKNILILKENIGKALSSTESYTAGDGGFETINFDIADIDEIADIESCDVYRRNSAARAYALKEAVIRLKDLKDRLGCGSIEELSGFDSPGFRYDIRNKLSKADIVVLNWNIAASFLPLSLIEIFAEVRDLYGMALNSKTLVFGNNADRIAHSDYLNYYKNRMKRDLADYNIAEPYNIVFGLAPAAAPESEEQEARSAATSDSDSPETAADSGAEKADDASESGGLPELCNMLYPVFCRNIEGKIRAALQRTEDIIGRQLKELDGVSDDSRSGLSGLLGRKTESFEDVSKLRRLICANKQKRFKGILEDIEKLREDYLQEPDNSEEEPASPTSGDIDNPLPKRGNSIGDLLAEKLGI
ncbi:hypothetical protein IJT93_11170 [bacterium]|nr:hypothetical protein [bacterium]